MRMRNKRGSIPVTLLVFMSVLVAAAALFIFITSGKIGERMADARILNKVYLNEEQISFYINNIMDDALEKTRGSDNFEEDFKINFLDELSKYKKDGKYIMSEFSKIEQQIGNTKVEDDKVIMEFKFEIDYEDEFIHVKYIYNRKFEKDIPKPYLIAFVLDYSGSMNPDGEKELERAMRELFASGEIQNSKKDVSYAVPFNESVWESSILRIEGNNPAEIEEFLEDIEKLSSMGDTNMYLGVIKALELLDERHKTGEYQTSIIVVSNGNSAGELQDVENAIEEQGLSRDVPIYTMQFGNAQDGQMKALAEWSEKGRVVGDANDLLDAFIAGCKKKFRNI